MSQKSGQPELPSVNRGEASKGAVSAKVPPAAAGNDHPGTEALMEAVRNMDVEIPMLLPGIRVTTSGEEDGYPIQAVQIMQFNGENWELQGEVIESGAVE